MSILALERRGSQGGPRPRAQWAGPHQLLLVVRLVAALRDLQCRLHRGSELDDGVGPHTSLTVRGRVVSISYYDIGKGDLKYLTRSPLSSPF
jgi:hypothetical protein